MTDELFKTPFSLKLFQKLEFPYKYGFLDRIYGKDLSSKKVSWVKTPIGLIWKLDLSMVTHRWILYGSYDFRFLRWVKNNIASNSIIVDSGANIGQTSLYFAKWCNKGKVLAFEPSPNASTWLADCLNLNKLSNVEVIRKGLGEDSSAGVLVEPGKGYNPNVHAFWSFISTAAEAEGENIVITKLEDELKARSIDVVDLWKLDVEGFEIPALEGAKELLKKKKIKAIYAELAVKRSNHKKVIEYLAGYGYKCHYISLTGKLYKPSKIPNYQTDGLFLPACDNL